ncbi:hypothetical protein BH11MYX3_BH11MYX3_03170 [soil metagenome]
MIVVVILAILAAIVVPGWFRASAKAKGDTEAAAMFAEIAAKEEQYKIENNVYLSAARCPATPTNAGVDWAAACLTGSSAWDNVRVNPPEKLLSCAYTITAGAAGSTPSPPAPFTMTTPVTGWWYVVAECDSDNSSTLNSFYFVSSVDTKVQKQNAGS